MVRLGQKGFLDIVEKSIVTGGTVLVENIGESVDPVLAPLLGRELIKKGKYVVVVPFKTQISTFFRQLER